MNVEQALIQAIVERPDDDLPRRALADWFEEHGREGPAELMRVQLALAGLPDEAPRQPELLARQGQLLTRHGKELARPVRRLVRGWELRRGCVEGVTLTAGQFPARAADLFARAPLRALRLSEPRDYQAVAACGLLSRLRELTLTADAYDAVQWGQILRSPFLEGLRSLRLHGGELEAESGQERYRFSQLERAEYRSCRIDAAALINESRMPRLRWLTLTGPRGHDQVPLRGLLRQIEGLELRGAWMEQGTLQQLATLVRPGGLRALRLGPGSLELRPLLSSGVMSGLHTLGLTGCGLGGGDAVALAGAGGPSRLVHLDLSSNPIGQRGVEALTRSDLLRCVTHLGLARVSTGVPLVRLLLEAPPPVLVSLDLRDNQVNTDDAWELAGTPLGDQLHRLDLRDNRLGDQGAEAFLYVDWPRLTWLNVRNNGLSRSAKAALRQRLGYTVHY